MEVIPVQAPESDDEVEDTEIKTKFDTMLGKRQIRELTLKEAREITKQVSGEIEGLGEARSLADVHLCLVLHLLKLHKMKVDGHEPLKVFTRIKKQHNQSCEKLASIFDECLSLLSKVDSEDPLIGGLEKSLPGFTFPDSLIQHKAKLLNPECKILVTGELCAGKTSVVNNLLEEKVLPSDFLSNTLTLCELKYGKTRGAKIHPWKTEEPVIILTDNDEFLVDCSKRDEIDYYGTLLVDAPGNGEGDANDSVTSKYEFVKKCETGPHPDVRPCKEEEFLPSVWKFIEEKDSKDEDNKRGRYKKVEVFLPNDLLKDGLTIIDSPGIGDSPRLTDIVIENLVHAFGFIYVINSNARGGVQEDRLQALLRKVRDLQSDDKQDLFSPESAIFVCNQWDKIPTSEHERLLKDTETKLRKCWGLQHAEQIIPFSAKEAEEIYEKGFMTLEYKNLLSGIEDLIPVGLENKIYISFRFLASLLQRLLRQLDGYLNNLHTTEEQRQQQFNDLHKRLEDLKKLSRDHFKILRKDVDKKVKLAYEELKKHLLDEQTVRRICNWKSEDAPMKVYSFDEVMLCIQKTMTARVAEEIEKWEGEQKFFDVVPDSISEKFHGFFLSKVAREMDDIQKCISNVKIEVKTSQAWKKKDKLDLSPLIMYEKFQNAVKSPAKAVAASFLLPVVVPIAVIAAIPALIMFGAVAAYGILTDSQKENYLSEYSDPNKTVMCLYKHSHKFLKFYCKHDDYLLKQLKDMMQPAYELIDSLEKKVPQLIESDNQQVLCLMKDKRKAEDILKFYPAFRETMSDFRKRLHHFQVHHMKRNTRDVVVHNFSDTKVIDDQPFCSGWFNRMYRAQLTTRCGRKSKVKTVSLRHIRHEVLEKDIAAYLAEEECMVLHEKQNIAKFIGVTIEGSQTIYQILEPLSGSLRSKLKLGRLYSRDDPPSPESDKTEILYDRMGDVESDRNVLIGDIAKQIGNGLHYLHNRGLVHLDLTLDAVAYKMEGPDIVVKLTNISVPKLVPLDPEMKKEDVGQYRYLPYDVLDGAFYTQESDMYCLGLMIWEMVTKEVVFENEIDNFETLEDLKNYIKTGRPKVSSSLSVVCEPTSDFDQTWASVMSGCWAPDPKDRLSSKTFLKYLNEPVPMALPFVNDHF